MMKIDSKSVINVLLIKHSEADDLEVQADSAFHFEYLNCSDTSVDFSLLDVDKHYDVIWYLQSEHTSLVDDVCWEKVKAKFVRSPKIVWSYTDQNLDPRIDASVPFLTIKRDQFKERKIQGLLISAQQFYSILHQGLSMSADVEVTQQIADLNIERLHKTLKDLEKERDKSLLAIKAKQSFMASVTHELRTPLTAIVGFLEILQETSLTEDQSTYVKAVKSASKNLHHLVNDILNFSKIQEGKLSIFKQGFNLVDEVESSFELLRNKAETKGLNYKLILDIGDVKFVKGDKLRLNQVLVNLISNAIKFTDKGTITVKVQNTFDDNITFSIQDTGIGINNDKLETVFESFSQAEYYTSHTYGGTGLGLSIVKEIIDLQNGSITVKSEINVGSVFSFQLNFPVIEALELKKKIVRADKSDLEHLRVLVIEDNQLNQMLIQKILTPVVSSLRICGDGESAVAVAEEEMFDVILTDLHLPRMNGLEALQAIGKQGMNMKTPVAVVSANIWEEELNKIRNAGVEMIIGKPYTKDDLLLKIVELSKQKDIPSLDLSYLNEISDYDEVFIDNVLKTFLVNSESDFSNLNVAFEESDFKQMTEVAHKMRSTLNMLKQLDLVELCKSIEENSTTISAEGIKKFRNELRDLQSLVRNYLDK